MGGKRAVKARGERGGWEMCGDGSGRGRKFKARGEGGARRKEGRSSFWVRPVEESFLLEDLQRVYTTTE